MQGQAKCDRTELKYITQPEDTVLKVRPASWRPGSKPSPIHTIFTHIQQRLHKPERK